MGTMKFALHMLKADFKRNLFYCGSLIFSTIVVFVFFNMTTNPNLGGDPTGVSSSFTTILSMIVVVIAMVMAFFANSYYLSGKSKELAIESLSGGSVLTLANYLLTQNTVIMLIAIPLGLGIGYLCIPLINSYLYAQLRVIDDVWKIYPTGFWMTIVSLTTEMFWLVLVDTGYAYRTEITSLISAEQQMNSRKGKMISNIPDFVYVILYMVPVAIFILTEANATVYLVASCLGLFGVSGLLNYTIPNLLNKLTRKKLLTHKHKIISVGNLNYSLRQSTTLIQMVIISAVFLVCFMCIYFKNPEQLILVLMSYIVLTFLMAVSIAYKVIIEANVRKKSFRHLKMIGYVTSDLKRIIRQEVTGLYSVIVLFPVVYLLIIFIKFIQTGMMTLTFAVGVILFYVIIFFFAGIISYFLYKQTILKGKKGR